MTPEAAGWVYDMVLTPRFKESAGAVMFSGARENRRDYGAGAAFLRTCICQVELCGHCGDGRPDRCAHREWTPEPVPATYVQDRRGMAIAEVWPAGRPCRWLCRTAKTERALAAR